VLADVPDDALVMNEEPFGPIAPLAPFAGWEEVLARANALPFGLAGYVFTDSQRTAEAAIRELKAQPGRELQLHGSGVLLRWLLDRDLVDELNLRIYPVVIGDGLRLFAEHGQSHDFELVESRSLPSGVMLQTYRPNGRATFGSVD
jgi:dihydrofolate reductase